MAQLTSPWTKHIGHVLGFLPGGMLVCDQCEEYVAGAASTEATPPRSHNHDPSLCPGCADRASTEATERPDLRAALVELMDAMGEYERAWMTSRTGYTRVGEAKQAVYAALTGASPSEPDPDATRLRNWIAEHRTVCPIMRESAAELFATLNEEWAAPEEERAL